MCFITCDCCGERFYLGDLIREPNDKYYCEMCYLVPIIEEEIE